MSASPAMLEPPRGAPSEPVAPAHAAQRAPLGLAGGQLFAWALLALTNGLYIAFAIGKPTAGWGARAFHHVFDAGQTVALGLGSAGAVALWQRALRRRREARPLSPVARTTLGALALALLAIAVAIPALEDDLSGLAASMAELGGETEAWTLALSGAVALVVPVAALVGRLLDRPFLRLLGPVVLAGAGTGSHFVLHHNYPGAHLFLAWAAAVLCGASVAGAGVPYRADSPRARGIENAVLALLALGAALSLVVPPSNTVRLELLRPTGVVVAPWLARMRVDDEAVVPVVPEDQKAWFVDRSNAAPVAPSAVLPPLDKPVVVLLSVDALRADVFDDDGARQALPALFRVRDTSVRFTRARSPGSQTVTAVASMMSGKYFSQLYWSSLRDGHEGLWPHADETPRFPELLARAGVATYTAPTARWLVGTYGIVRGFDEEEAMTQSREYAHAKRVGDAIVARLDRQGDGPLFVYTHFLDPHAPYDRGGKQGSNRERWMGEVARVDREIGRIDRALRKPTLRDRAVLIVTADHGEAFGEHGQSYHASTLYEELVHVPLLVRCPGVGPHIVGEPVSLIDLGPTVLDIFGLETPGHFMGESLVPAMAGTTARLTRPLLAEGRLKQSLVAPDGFKVIVDRRAGSVELYDLASDPGERVDLYDRLGAEGTRRLDVLRTFFQVHTLRREGYRVPYRR